MKPTRLSTRLLVLFLYFVLGLQGTAFSTENDNTLRFGLTPVFLDDQAEFLEQWRAYLEKRLGRRVEFVQRGSYREINQLLLRGRIDAAWICGAPYVRHSDALRLVAAPLHRGQPLYRSLLIVSADDTRIKSWEDLQGRVFAYSDPDSNSGYLYPQYAMLGQGLVPGTLFRKSFFTWSHRSVVEAVADGLADAGAVDSYIWEALSDLHPELTAATRVVARSPQFGFPPIVSRRGFSESERKALRQALLDMNQNREGRALLSRLYLDGFTKAEPDLYDEIARMHRKAKGDLP